MTLTQVKDVISAEAKTANRRRYAGWWGRFGVLMKRSERVALAQRVEKLAGIVVY